MSCATPLPRAPTGDLPPRPAVGGRGVRRVLAAAALAALLACGDGLGAPGAAPPGAAVASGLAAAAAAPLRFGVEIEVAGLTGYDAAACSGAALLRYLGFDDVPEVRQPLEGRPWLTALPPAPWLDGRGWTSTCEVSVWWPRADAAAPRRWGDELVSPILEASQRDEPGRVAALAAAAGGRVTPSSGLHVHVGVAALPVDALLHLVRLVAAHQGAIYRVFKVTPQRRCDGAAPLTAPLTAALRRSPPDSHAALAGRWAAAQGIHCSGLDLGPLGHKGTVEFRLFNGSLEPEMVRLAIDFALALVQRAAAAGPFAGADWAALAVDDADDEAAVGRLLRAVDAELAARLAHLDRRPAAACGPGFVAVGRHAATCDDIEAHLDAAVERQWAAGA